MREPSEPNESYPFAVSIYTKAGLSRTGRFFTKERAFAHVHRHKPLRQYIRATVTQYDPDPDCDRNPVIQIYEWKRTDPCPNPTNAT